MNPEEHSDVLVVGAGPVGLYTALCLAEQGLWVRIVDKYRRSTSNSYALALHAQTLELLHGLGLARELIANGQPATGIRLHNGGPAPREIDLTAVEGRFPFVLVVPQSLLESALEARLADKGVAVEWGTPLMVFEVDADGVCALVSHTTRGGGFAGSERLDTRAKRIRASFMIGADGYDSLVRRLLGVEYANLGDPMSYGLLEFRSKMERPETVQLVLHDHGTDALWPLGPDRGRWNVRIADNDTRPGAAHLLELIHRRAPWFRQKIDEVCWLDTVQFERRLVESFGLDRVWLAGDAAHLASPIGVQNMNVSLREARDLCLRIAAILAGDDSLGSLRRYDAERKLEWSGLIDGTGDPDRSLAGSLPASGAELRRLLKQTRRPRLRDKRPIRP